jgi:uncharacterized protein YaiL (DUF2058 family)
MKRRLLAYALVPALGLGILAANMASAHGMFMSGTPQEQATQQAKMFEQQASLFGITVDEAKTYWAEGKTIADIAKDKGLTEDQLRAKMDAARQAEMKTRIQNLVDQGVITQAQADKRLQFLSTQSAKLPMGKGFHRGFGF